MNQELKVGQVLRRMNGGHGEASYYQNSIIPKVALDMAKSMREEAIHQTISRLFPIPTEGPYRLTMAELGCSSGPTGLVVAGELITAVHKQLGSTPGSVVEVFLNDLPRNDFNTMLKAVPSFKDELRKEIGFHKLAQCFFYGVASSFYERLFRPNSIHFLHSSFSLHYLSQVPQGVGRSHKSNIYLTSESPSCVVKAYYQQFQKDFSSFLSYRSEELVKGGCMIFTLLGRSNDPSIKGSGFIWEPLAFVLHQMVTEGLIKEETMDLFNIPMYTPSPKEIEIEVHKEGSFEIKGLQVSELDWEVANINVDKKLSTPPKSGLIKCMRSVVEPMLSHHFGPTLMDQLFQRYEFALADCMAKESIFFTNVSVSLMKNM